jgi:hypothetical protein
LTLESNVKRSARLPPNEFENTRVALTNTSSCPSTKVLSDG